MCFECFLSINNIPHECWFPCNALVDILWANLHCSRNTSAFRNLCVLQGMDHNKTHILDQDTYRILDKVLPNRELTGPTEFSIKNWLV